ncbi:MAG: hypothetical protein OCD76_14760 [Reichenbachiella sp.]
MIQSTKAHFVCIISIALLVLSGCLSDNSDYYNMDQSDDALYTISESVESTPVTCSDKLDNDGDDLIDCDDSDCAKISYCLPEGLCDDGVDNDLDALIDCDDPDCRSNIACLILDRENTQDMCQDKADNDNDKAIDCDDADCLVLTICAEEGMERTLKKCKDGLDNDDDGDIDCDDSNCAIFTHCTDDGPAENTFQLCSDGIDNDSDDGETDGGTDCEDKDCEEFNHCFLVENTLDLCSDELDNDDDEFMDCDDSDCRNFAPCMENTLETCTDKKDNDKDGDIDCDDLECFVIGPCKPSDWDDFPVASNDTSLVVFADKHSDTYVDMFTEPRINTSVGSAQWRYKHLPTYDDVIAATGSGNNFTTASDCKDALGFESSDGGDCLLVNFGAGADWGGAFIQFGDYILIDAQDAVRDSTWLRDLSPWLHNRLQFEIKSTNPDVTLKPQWGTEKYGFHSSEDYELTSYGYEPDGEWHKIEISFDNRILDAEWALCSNPLGFWAIGGSAPIYIDGIKFEGPSGNDCRQVKQADGSNVVYCSYE